MTNESGFARQLREMQKLHGEYLAKPLDDLVQEDHAERQAATQQQRETLDAEKRAQLRALAIEDKKRADREAGIMTALRRWEDVDLPANLAARRDLLVVAATVPLDKDKIVKAAWIVKQTFDTCLKNYLAALSQYYASAPPPVVDPKSPWQDEQVNSYYAKIAANVQLPREFPVLPDVELALWSKVNDPGERFWRRCIAGYVAAALNLGLKDMFKFPDFAGLDPQAIGRQIFDSQRVQRATPGTW